MKLSSERKKVREERLNEVLLMYLDALEAGQKLDRARFLAEHPDLRPELETFFGNYDAAERLAAPLRAASCAFAGEKPLESDVSVNADCVPAPLLLSPLARERKEGDDIGELGDFRLLREVGRGGMGVVYEAEQISLRRRVALKVLPFAAAIDARQLQRFKHEALAAANLCHENIVPVHAVGVDRGVHYYAMRFIEGQSLAALIDDMRRAGGELDRQAAEWARPGLDAEDSRVPLFDASAETQVGQTNRTAASMTRARSSRARKYFHGLAALGRQAGLALEHSHQMGIVHRDIKPANLLLDNAGHLWVTDFGLAQFQCHVGMTLTGELLGTLRYVSPEQALAKRGLVDHRTDIYSLGATLYEILTLKPIFDGADRHALLSQICFEEPVAPRKHDPAIPVDLETILLKALAKNPAERYGTALELADDLHRFVEEKPILARRPRLFERIRMWCRRHPPVVAAGLLVLVVCLAGLLVSTWMIAQEHVKTQAAWKNEKERAADARKAVDLLVDVSEEKLALDPHLEDVRTSLLVTALDYYQSFLDNHGPDVAAQGDLERSKDRVQSILKELATLRTARLVGLATKGAVQRDLHLGENQRQQLAKLPLPSWKKGPMLPPIVPHEGLTPEERRQKLYDIARSQEMALNAILDKRQLRRLQQIELQLQGPAAFHQSYPIGVLKLTQHQVREIRKISEEAIAALRCGPPQRFRAADTDRSWAERVRKAEVEQVLAVVLTADQRARWQEMIGAPFQSARSLPGFDGAWPPPGVDKPRYMP